MDSAIENTGLLASLREVVGWEVAKIMPRYFFHFVWPDDACRDSQGVEFDGLVPAYWHAIGLARRVRHEFPDAGNDWLIEIGDESGRKPLVVLPTGGPLFGRRTGT